MKNAYKFVLVALAFSTFGCSNDDSDNAEYAMHAKINGATFRANSPSNNDRFSDENLFNHFPIEDYVLLQARGRQQLWKPEINLWLKRSDIGVGTYEIGQETFSTPPSHFIDLIDNSNEIEEHTKSGTVTITEVNQTNKTVMGTFQFTTVQSIESQSAPDFVVTNGTFKYKFE